MIERLPKRRREQWELELIRQRMLKTRTQRVVDGRHAGGRVAYGYRLALEPVEGLLVVESTEAAVVRKIFTLRAQGQSYRQNSRYRPWLLTAAPRCRVAYLVSAAP